jgi:hypothetical protein
MKAIYKNRYKDEIIFEHEGDTVVMTGGSWFRYSWPNVYDKAYEAFIEDNAKHLTPLLTLEEFKKEVHNYKNETMRPYAELVYSDKDTIEMVDPSGGPYISLGDNLRMFFGKDYQDLIITKIELKESIVTFKIK